MGCSRGSEVNDLDFQPFNNVLTCDRIGTWRGDIHSGRGHLDLPHRRGVDSSVHVLCWALRGGAKLATDPGGLLSFALAVLCFSRGGRVLEFQTIGVLS
jgi:hypothetical protein